MKKGNMLVLVLFYFSQLTTSLVICRVATLVETVPSVLLLSVASLTRLG